VATLGGEPTDARRSTAHGALLAGTIVPSLKFQRMPEQFIILPTHVQVVPVIRG
jgi:hypothetical protein